MSAKYRVSVVSHTHWDREWYMPFQGFRARLVYMLDDMIEKMESDPRYRFFLFDGQSILFSDYLSIRPEMEPRLRALSAAGRIASGPFYVAPDLSLPGAETHVRNLMMGMKVAAEWGPVLKNGYVIDVFGHISQFPQMLKKLGIETAVQMRGIIDEDCGAEFIWRSPDGSEVLAIHLTNQVSYSDYWYRVRQPDEGKLLNMDEAVVRLHNLIQMQKGRCSTSEILLMDGVDHIEIQRDTPDLIERYNAEHGEDCEVVHENLPDYLDRLSAAVDREKLPLFEGELRTPNKQSPLGQVFFGYHCSHPEIKEANDRCEALLQFWAEPLLAANFLLTGKCDTAFVWKAWEYLLQNQAHDSICGCSIDQVHKDMMHHFDQCRLLGEDVVRRNLKPVALAQSAPCDVPGAQVAHIFNPAGLAVDGTVLLELPIPTPRPERFRLLGPDGVEVPWQIVSERKAITEVEANWNCIPRFPAKDRLTVAAPLSIPATGLAAYTILPHDRPMRHTETLMREPGIIANEFIEVAVDGDGSLTLWDKRSDHMYEGLLRFEDRGDVGDGWNYFAPERDERVLSHGAKVSVVCDGPLYAALRIETTMSIPRGVAPDGRGRSAERVDMNIVSTVSILRDDPAVYVETVVDNTARDHKLRVLFPTQLDADTWATDTPFDLTERPIAVLDTHDWDEPAQEIWWQQSLCTVNDGDNGLAIIAPECKESACIDDDSRTLALSLFRAFGRTVGTNGEDGPQMLGRQSFRYQIVPYDGDPVAANLLGRSAQMRAGLRAIVLPPHEGSQPNPMCLVEAAPASLQLSAYKKREGGDEIIVRYFNPAAKALKATVTFPMGIAAAWMSDLKEDLGETLEIADGKSVRLKVGAKEIITLAVRHH